MTKNLSQIFLLFILITISSCDLPNDAAVIDTQIPPTIIEASIAPTNIDFGTISGSGTIVDVAIAGYVNANDDNGLEDIVSVTYNVFSPAGKIITNGTLRDDGVSPDVNSSDGKFNSTIALQLSKNVIGTYTIQFSTTDKEGFRSNTFNLPLKIILSTNNPPSVFTLSAPDTVEVPPSSDLVNIIKISLGVSDPQGLSDIVAVALTSQRPDSTVAGTFFLYDDGGNTPHPQFGISTGDSTANDGIYSIRIPLFSDSQKNTYRDFIFAARDQSGAISNAITKRIHLR